MLYVDSVTTFSYYVRQLRAQRRRGSLTTTKSLACLMIVPPRGQGDGYITAWYQVSIKTLKLPRHGRFNARRSSDARSSLAPLLRIADEGAGPEPTWTASARSCASGMRFFLFRMVI